MQTLLELSKRDQQKRSGIRYKRSHTSCCHIANKTAVVMKSGRATTLRHRIDSLGLPVRDSLASLWARLTKCASLVYKIGTAILMPRVIEAVSCRPCMQRTFAVPPMALSRGAQRVCLLLCFAGLLWTGSLNAAVTTCTNTVSSGSTQSCQSAQVEALIELYAATGGADWIRSAGWSAITPTSTMADVCDMLTSNNQGWCCDTQAQCPVNTGISMLILPYNNLRGTLPSTFLAALGPTLLSLVLSGTVLRNP